MKINLLLLFFFLVIQSATAQNKFTNYADSLYKAKSYKEAAIAYLLASDSSKLKAQQKSSLYNAACCYALINDTTNATRLLNKAVFEMRYQSQGLLYDEDLTSIHQTAVWKRVKKKIEQLQQALHDPSKAKLITTDIHHFWKAFDLAKKDTANMKAIFQKEYFDNASPGLEDYFITKIGSLEKFVANQKSKPKFYNAIRKNTLSIDNMKPGIFKIFHQFKSMYADAIFPDIYFVIGRWNSAGTVSDNGLLLGIDQIANSRNVPKDELNLWEQKNFKDVKDLPIIIAHELIHSQQDKLKRDTTLLSYAIQEGMADFFAELLTGVNPSQRQYEFAKNQKKKIWNDFAKEMYLDRYSNWIANGDQERPDHPSDLGYYIGYEICKSYYNEMPDKKQAIKDLFTITDYKAFLKKSRYEEKMAQLKD